MDPIFESICRTHAYDNIDLCADAGIADRIEVGSLAEVEHRQVNHLARNQL